MIWITLSCGYLHWHHQRQDFLPDHYRRTYTSNVRTPKKSQWILIESNLNWTDPWTIAKRLDTLCCQSNLTETWILWRYQLCTTPWSNVENSCLQKIPLKRCILVFTVRLNSSNAGQDRRQSPYRPQVPCRFDLRHQGFAIMLHDKLSGVPTPTLYAHWRWQASSIGTWEVRTSDEENSNFAIQVW